MKINNKENITLLSLKRKNMKTLDALNNTKCIEEINLEQTKITAETEMELKVIKAKAD